MPAWVTVSVAEIESALQAPELAALREAALGDNSADPIVGAIADVIARVRGYCGSRSGNVLDRDQTLIPPELHQDAIWLVIQTLKLRLGVATPLSEDQRARVRTAEQDLKDVALGRLLISPPLNPDYSSSQQGGGGAEVLPPRPRRFGGGGDGGYRPRVSSGQTLGQAGIVDGVSNTGSYFDPAWLTGLSWLKIVNRPTNVADSGLMDAVSTAAMSAAIAAALISPAFGGVPTAPTAAGGTNTTQVATTAFVRGEVASLIATAPSALDTLNELAAALGNDPSFATTVTNALALKAPLASPALTGVPTAPTAAAGTATTQIATTAFVGTAVSNLVNAAPGALDTLAELAAALGNDASFATTVTNALALKAPLANPTFTGSLTLPNWTTAGRPAAPVAGMIGWNSTLSRFDHYTGGSGWKNFVRLDGDTMTGPMTIASGTAATAVSPLTITQTWNGSEIVFPGVVLDFTDTLSSASSLMLDMRVGGASKAKFDKAGNLTLYGASGLTINNASGAQFQAVLGGLSLTTQTASGISFWTNNVSRWSVNGTLGHMTPGSTDTYDIGSSVSSLRVRNGYFGTSVKVTGAASAIEVWNTDGAVSTTNYEKGVFDFLTNANILTVGAVAGGTGSTRDLYLVGNNVLLRAASGSQVGLYTGGTPRWWCGSTGTWYPNATNTYDIGTTTNRPKDIYLGGMIYLGAGTTARPSLNIPAGTAPTTPTDGDIWNDGTNLKFRVGGATYTLTKA